jgi:hypothetical protein
VSGFAHLKRLYSAPIDSKEAKALLDERWLTSVGFASKTGGNMAAVSIACQEGETRELRKVLTRHSRFLATL